MRTLDDFIEGRMMEETAGRGKEFQGPYDLPEGWKWVRLGDIVIRVQYGLSKAMNLEGVGLPILRMNNITYDGQLDLSDLKYVDIDEQTAKKYLLNNGDIIFNRTNSRELVGKTTVFNREGNFVFASYLIRVVINKEKAIPEYVSFFLNSRSMKETFFRMARPAVQMANINTKELCTINIPLPPLEEQKRIVLRLEELVNRAEEAKRLRKLAKEEAEKIMQAVLHKVFSRAEEEGWGWVKLKGLVSIESGKRPKGGSTNTGVPSLGGEQLLPSGEINWEKLRYIPEDFFDGMKKGKVKQRDVLIVKDGATTGKTAYVEALPFKKVAVNEHVFIIRSLNESKVLNEYLFFVIFSEIGQKQIRELFHGAAQGGITQRNVEEVSIPLPPCEEQKRIAMYLNKIREAIKFLSKLQQRTEEELEKLVPAILDKAFKGEL